MKPLAFLLVLAAAWPLRAQQPASVPTVRLKLDPGTECTATIRHPRMEKWLATPEAAKAKLPPMVVKRVLTYTGKDASLTITLSNKASRSEFFRGKYSLVFDSQTGPEISRRGSGSGLEVDFRKDHFPELKWVSPANYKGIQQTSAGKYLVYEDGGPSPVSKRVLYVDPQTLYPASFQSFNEIDLYAYAQAAASGKIPLPPELAKSWEKIKADHKRYFKRDMEE